MDSVLAGLVILFLFLLASFSLATRFFDAQDGVQEAWQEMQNRLGEESRSDIAPIAARVTDGGEIVELTYRNTGSVRLTDYEQWDVVIQYYTQDAAQYQIMWLPLDTTGKPNTWKTLGIYQNAEGSVLESYERGILNPSEEIVIQIKISPAAGQGQTLIAAVITGSGTGNTIFATRNVPPVLIADVGLTLTSHTSADITTDLLQAVDVDNSAEELLYTVTTAPQQGSLSLPSTFNQSQIDEGLLSYTHTGNGDDSFSFVISDGEDMIGTYTFNIVASNASPILMTNIMLTVPLNATVEINNTILSTLDVDNSSADLIYIITSGPSIGTIIPGSTFTQSNIDAGMVSYTRMSAGLDSFQFMVSDGEATIGPFTFTIAMP